MVLGEKAGEPDGRGKGLRSYSKCNGETLEVFRVE